MAEAKAESAPKPKKKMLMFIIIGVIVLVVLVGGGLAALLLMKSGDPVDEAAATDAAHSAATTKKVEKKKAESGHGKGPIFEKLPQFTVNLNSENGEVMQTDIAIELPDAPTQETVKALMPKIQSGVNKLLSSKKPEEIKTAPGRDKLEGEVKELINKIIEAEGESGVHSVNFTTFIIR